MMAAFFELVVRTVVVLLSCVRLGRPVGYPSPPVSAAIWQTSDSVEFFKKIGKPRQIRRSAGAEEPTATRTTVRAGPHYARDSDCLRCLKAGHLHCGANRTQCLRIARTCSSHQWVLVPANEPDVRNALTWHQSDALPLGEPEQACSSDALPFDALRCIRVGVRLAGGRGEDAVRVVILRGAFRV